jgi:hypothetical protein
MTKPARISAELLTAIPVAAAALTSRAVGRHQNLDRLAEL